jgi:hypothetical protein
MTETLPRIGSEWIARDGRRMRVEAWNQESAVMGGRFWAWVTVLNPVKGQRRRTTMLQERFGSFLTPAEGKRP